MNGFAQTQEDILSPSGWGFIIFTLFAAFMLNLIPWGQVYGVPDFLAVTLLFWSIHQHRRVGIGTAFCLGLLMDVNNATFLGETALAYTLMTYFAITLHRRILWFSWRRQVWYIFLLLCIPSVAGVVIQLFTGGESTGWFWILDCIIGALIWPLAYWLLSWPQRRAAKMGNQI